MRLSSRRLFALVTASMYATACGGSALLPWDDDGGSNATTDGGDAASSDGAVAFDASGADATLDAPADANDASPSDAESSDGSDANDAGALDGGTDADAGIVDPPTIIVGAANRILLIGTVVTPDAVIEGEVLVVDSSITCVAAGTSCESAVGAAGATVIDTKGIIAPGLIDTHNHILFDIFDDDDWLPAHTYTNHDDWTTEARYGAMLDVKQCLADDSQGKPAWCASTPYGTAAGSLRCEMDKYGELKGLIAGTTSIVGLPGTSSGCFGSLARSIDVSQNGLGGDKIQTSAIFPPSRSAADSVCSNIEAGTTDAYLIHCGEGTDAKTMAEFAKLGTVSTMQGCLYVSQTTVTHGVAFNGGDFALMADAGMKLTWSPQSNVSLYDATADIPTALDAGVRIALGPDWSMGGSENMLAEMRFAKAWSDTHWSGLLSAQDLVTMATTNGASVVARSELGRVQVGAVADLAVFTGDRANPYDAILSDRPKDVRLVMVGGTVLYGDLALQQAGPALPGCETVDICGTTKFLCVATTSSANKLDQSLGTIRTALSQALVTADSLTPGDGFDFAPLAPLVKCE